MALPGPEPGLVISFSYLWRREQDEGSDNARYPRPCAIVLSVRRAPSDEIVVMVAPITTKPPQPDQHVVEIPTAVKRHLGLDVDVASWAVVDEVNEFTWPGFDIEPDSRGRLAYGFLPPGLYERIRRGVLDAVTAGRLSRVKR
jgi:hypothetical protein